MNCNCRGWKWLSHVGIVIMLTAPCLQAADKTNTNAVPAVPLVNAMSYFSNRASHTSLQNEQIVRDLLGKIYSGVVVVRDVKENGDVIVITEESQGIQFWIKDAKLKEKAGQVQKGNKILITARLTAIGDNYGLTFEDVQSFDLQLQSQAEEKK